MSHNTPFAFAGRVRSPQERCEERLEMSFDPGLQRNRVKLNERWADVVDVQTDLAATTLLTMTQGATMTQFDPGQYKLDDDR